VTEADLAGHLDNAGGNEKNAEAATKNANGLLSSDNQLYEALSLLKGLNILGARSHKAAAQAEATTATAAKPAET
jgi:carboxyl-terminal processing protease